MARQQGVTFMALRKGREKKDTTVPITHTNAKGQIFTLYQGTTKTGKPRYYFAMKSEGTLATAIPADYEIYENPNAQVFLRRIPPKIITDEERQVVEEGMRTYATVKDYKIDVKGNALLIYTAIQEIDALADLFKDLYPDPTANVELMANLRKAVHYSPMLVFQLTDATRRTFQTQRYCFLGSVDDWIEIGKPGKLTNLVKRYVKHLGQDSYVELW
jgi:hypothetical protein